MLEIERNLEYYLLLGIHSKQHWRESDRFEAEVKDVHVLQEYSSKHSFLLPTDASIVESTNNSCDLSVTAREALQAHLRDQKEQEEAEFLIASGFEYSGSLPGMSAFREDWSLRQFWYTTETAQALAARVMPKVLKGRVAIICAPTLWKELNDNDSKLVERETFLLEYDDRFGIFGDRFVKYDLNYPLKLSPVLLERAGTFDFCFVDPPFLTEDCISKIAETVKLLLKPEGKILMCTGEECRDIVRRCLSCHPIEFTPTHKTLCNPFMLYSNHCEA